jgi:LysR family glycine cleavage system transcriptional activator
MAIRRIPSLNWLRVFETAARAESFARAAQLLNMSAPAVSQQIKALEAHLNTPLFERGPRSVTLTRAGEAFLPAVQQALRSVETTAASLFGTPSGEPLSVQASLMFACSWLAPRLGAFQARHPEVLLQMMTANQNEDEDFLRKAADLQIVFGTDPGRGGDEDLLFGEVLTPVAVPALAGEIERPEDLLDQRLIEIATHRSGWLQVLETAQDADLSRARFCFADTTQLALAMAAGGFGIALARAPATDALVETYGLVPCLENLTIQGGQSYYLVYPARAALAPAARAFRTWLLEETAAYR